MLLDSNRAAPRFAEVYMNTLKLTRLAAACTLALGLAACGADGNNNTNTNTNTNNGSAKTCQDLEQSGAITTVQGALCDILDGSPAGELSDVINNLIGTDGTLGALTSQLESLIGPNGQLAPLNDLLTMLLGANDPALGPLTKGLNSILILLNAGEDPTAIAGALGQFGGGTGTNGPTGTPLDALLALGGTDNPLTALIGQLPGLDRLPGAGGSTPPATGENAGAIDSVETLVGTLTNNTALVAVDELVAALLNAQNGALSPLTGPLNDLTNVNGGPLGPLTQVIDGLIAQNDAALAPVITALNGVLVGLLTNQDPAAIAEALQGLASGLSAGAGGAGGNPLAGLLPGGSSTPGANSGLIVSVQFVVGNLTDNTALAQLSTLVNDLVGVDAGALAVITKPLNDLTADQLSFVTDLVNQLAVNPGSPVGAVVDGLNGILQGLLGGLGGLGGLLGGN